MYLLMRASAFSLAALTFCLQSLGASSGFLSACAGSLSGSALKWKLLGSNSNWPSVSLSMDISSKVVILNLIEFFLHFCVAFWCSTSIFIFLVWVTENVQNLSSSKLLFVLPSSNSKLCCPQSQLQLYLCLFCLSPRGFLGISQRLYLNLFLLLLTEYSFSGSGLWSLFFLVLVQESSSVKISLLPLIMKLGRQSVFFSNSMCFYTSVKIRFLQLKQWLLSFSLASQENQKEGPIQYLMPVQFSS